MNTLYMVWYKKDTGEKRLGHVKAYNQSEANAKAQRFVIWGGSVISVESIG